MNKNKDINIKIEDYILNCRVVAIIEEDNKILFQKKEHDKYWSLPGGKIEIGEKTIDALKRELKEELGITNFNVETLIIVSEHFFTFKNNKYHQFIFGHKVKYLDNKKTLKELEFKGIEKDKNLIFKWFDKEKLESLPIKPDFLGQKLKNITENEVTFISYKENN